MNKFTNMSAKELSEFDSPVQDFERDLETVQFAIASIEQSMSQDIIKLEKLRAKEQELCGEMGHDFDPDSGGCEVCGYQNDRDFEPDYDI